MMKHAIPILVVRLSAIGDLILTSSILGQLSEEGYELHLLCKDAYRSVATCLPGVSKVWSWERDRGALLQQNTAFEAVLDLQGTGKSKRWVRKMKLPTYTYKKPYARRFLLLLTKSAAFSLEHVVDRYGKAAAPLLESGFDGRVRALVLPELPLDLPEKYIAVVIGGTYATKRPDFDQWQTLLTGLRTLGLPIVLLGGPEEAGVGESLEQPLGSGVKNYSGYYSVLQSLVAVRDAEVVVTGDTGLMHAAANFGRPTVSLWGGTHPTLGFTPWPAQPEERQIVTTSWWSPLSKHGKRAFWMPNPMKKLPLDRVVEATASILRDRTTP